MATDSAVRIMESNRSGKWAPPAAYPSPVITEELGMLLRGHNNIHRDQVNTVAPNRSESAPPSMEGSFAAFDQFQADPSYSTFYPSSNIDSMNPRFPIGNDWRLAPSGPLYVSRSSLSTHQEEPEDDKAESMPSQNTAPYFGRHKSLVDLVQEDFPKVPSQIYSQTHSSSNVEESVNQDFQSLSLGSLSLKISTSPEQKSGVASSDATIKDPSMRADQIFPQRNDLTTLDKAKDSQDKQQNSSYLLPAYQPQGTLQGGANKTGSVEIPQLPFVHGPAVHPPLYATAAAYMTPGNSLYPNYGASGLYSPPYSGYALGSSYLPPYLTGYPSQTSFPSQFNGNPGQSLTGQSPTSESISRERFFGPMQPPFSDPLSMQYYQQLVQDSYNIPMQYSRFPSPLSPADSFPLQNEYNSPGGSFGVPSPRTPASNYISTPTGLGFMHQSPLGSPVLPGSPIAGAGRRYEMGFSQGSPRNLGGYGRWQGQRGADGLGDHRKHSFLEELKASGTQRIELSDIVGRIVEFSVDQHGSRFIQQKLENCSAEEKELVFKEVLPHAPKLITDVFGNYVVQKFFEHGTPEQRKELASRLTGHMLPLSLQMYGCRVIQKALEVIEPEQKKELVLELDGNVMKCVRDQNGNHVIQKCIECLPADNIDFIISAFKSHVATLSTHPYGCRVIQRILEHCSDETQSRTIVNEILESAYDLAQDQYGNYVIQHVLGRGKPYERSKIISQLSEKIVQLSQHKYASNVIEKCLEFGDTNEREILIEEILVQSEENDCLLAMMKDQFANYVVQKILEISNSRHREMLLNRIQIHIDCLKKFTYGKHIVARYEQLSGEGSGTSDC